MSPRLTLTTINMECHSASELADFYQRLLSWPRRRDESDWVVIAPEDRSHPGLSFQTDPEYVRPTWPAEPGKQQQMLHLDIEVDDLDSAGAHAIEAGAVLAGFQPQEKVRVYFDPAGHPFCLWVE